MKNILLFISFLGFSFSFAAETDVTTENKATPQKLEAATSCVACHGNNGEGVLDKGFPRIAALPEMYLTNQLNDYASGVRNNSVMTPIAKAISESDRAALGKYFSLLPKPKVPGQAKKSTLISQGEKISSKGLMKLQIQACANCHGPGGTIDSLAIPNLAGQSLSYIQTQLHAWKNGERKNSPNQMAPIAERLDDQSIKSLAAYFASVRTK